MDQSEDNFFQIAEPVNKDTFLKVTEEVIEAALFFFAPFGLPRYFRDAYTTEQQFIQYYGPCFQEIVEALSDVVYKEHGVTESEMAVSMHKYVEELNDPDAVAVVKRMLNALQDIYSAPRVMELPSTASLEQLEALAFLFSDIHNNMPEKREAKHSTSSPETSARRTQTFHNFYPEVFWSLGFLLTKHPQDRTWRPRHRSSLEGSTSQKKEQAVAQWLASKQALESKLCQSLKHIHIQALVESYSKQRGELNTEDALGSVCERGFDGDLLVTFCRQLRDDQEFDRLQRVQLANEKKSEGDSLKANGLPLRAVEMYTDAIRLGFGAAPDGLMASFYGSLALTHLQVHAQDPDYECEPLFEKMLQMALDLDPFCGTAHQAQGMQKLKVGDLKGAVNDLILGFDLQGNGRGMEMNQMVEEGQMIEMVSREAVREEALELYLNRKTHMHENDENCREQTETLKGFEDFSVPTWLADSYFSSFLDEPRDDLLSEVSQTSIAALSINDIDSEHTIPKLCAAETLYNKALHHKNKKEYPQALCALKQSLETEEDFQSKENRGLALNQYGTFLYLSGHMKKALQAMEDSINQNPALVNSYLKIAGIFCDMDDKDSALMWFQKALELGEHADVYLHRGQFYLLKNELYGAKSDIGRAIYLCEQCKGKGQAPPLAYATMAITYFKLDMTSPFRLRQMETAYEYYPENVEILLFYGELLTQVGDFNKALELYRKASLLSPDCPLPFVNAGRAYMALNDFSSARAHLLQGMVIDQRCTAALLDMGQLLLNKGENEAALVHYKKAADCARYLTEVQEALASQQIAQAHMNAQAFKQTLQ